LQDMEGVAQEDAEALHREITYTDIPPEAWEQGLHKAGLPAVVYG